MIHSTKMDQDWSFRCQGSLNHQDQYIFWWNEAVEVIEATEAVEAVEVTEAAEVLRPEKSLLRTSEFTRFSNSALFWCFETKFILVESWNINLNFSAFPVGGCWGQLLFWKMVVVPNNSLSQHSRTIFKPNLSCISLSLASEPIHKVHFEMRHPVVLSTGTDFVTIYWSINVVGKHFNRWINRFPIFLLIIVTFSQISFIKQYCESIKSYLTLPKQEGRRTFWCSQRQSMELTGPCWGISIQNLY